MKFSPILFISALCGSALADTIQLPNLPDGNYLISLGEDGKAAWTELPAGNVTDAPAPVISKRGSTSLLQNDFYNHGWDAFYATCAAGGNKKYPKNTVVANYQGTSVSYMCAYTTNPCRPEEWHDAVDWAASNCHGRSNGWMEPGFLDVPAWNKRYGYAKAGSSIC
ncbi:hypothetical protein QBC44DRAFT_367643 [Cladorrhinum sp. PSN332]|nr:hypothetical protein QBC44DRAFT_367643 [Cladorrhinum sp. PSN332]